MLLNDITAQLDTFFDIEALPPDSPFSGLVPAVYGPTGIDLESVLEPRFLERFHGLMINNGQAIERLACAVFLSDEIVGKVTRASQDTLLICHHPLLMETSDRGFLPLSEASLAAMQEAGMSVYTLHTPLDVHGSVSTSRALARELGLRHLAPYYKVPGGYAGVYGHLPALLAFDALLERVRAVSGVPDVNFIPHHQVVQQVAVLAGGTDVSGIQEAEALGCDVMVTGTYDNLVQTDIGRQHKQAFERIKYSLEISLVECSHYASEAVVMRQDMVDLCVARFGLPCEFVPQDDPWL